MIKIKNKNRLISRLKKLSASSQLPVKQTMLKSAKKIQNESKKLISKGSRTGVVYYRGEISSRRSAPGEPPKTDTGVLVSSINKIKRNDGFAYTIGSFVKYAWYLEFGKKDNKILPRPWLQPTFLKNKKNITRNIRKSVKKALRGAIK